MEKIKNFKVKAIVLIAVIVAAVVGIAVFTQVSKNTSDAAGSGNDKIADGTLEFQAVDNSGQRVTINTAPVGKDVTLHVALTTSAESHSGEDYVIKMDNADFVIDGFSKNGDYIELNSNGNIIRVTIAYNSNKSAYDLIVTGWKNGTSLSFDLGGHKNSENKTTVTMVTNSATHGGLIEADLTAYGDINYSNTKIVNHNKLTISSDGKVIRDENGNELNEKLTYILRGNLDISNSANATINGKVNVSDIINIPAGIDISDLETLKSYLTVSGTGLSDSNVDYSIIQADSGTNNIRKLKITYTLDSANEINDFTHSNNYTIGFDIASLIKNNGTNIAKGSEVTLTNDLNSEYITQFDTITADRSTASTTIEKDQGPIYSYNKEIISVNGGNVTDYVTKGDTITYRMTIDNTGLEAGTINYTDYIPANTKYISSSIDNSLSKNVSNATWEYDENTGSVKGTATIGADGKIVLIMTVEVTSDQIQQINNTFFDKTVSIPVKKLEDYTIDKSVDKNYFPANDKDRTLTYTITVTNTGAGPLTDKEITDELPNGVKYISASVGENTDVSVSYENGVIKFTGINLQPGESKKFTITCEVDGTVTGWISNTAVFIDKSDFEGIQVEDPFNFSKYVNKIENGNRVTSPKGEIEANNGDSIEYTMYLKNKGDDYDLSGNNVVMVDVIPSTIAWDPSNVYYTIGDDEDTHYTANITTENVDGGVKLTWTIDSLNGNTTLANGQTVTLHVFGTVNTGKITTITPIKNTAKIENLKKESTAIIRVKPTKEMEVEKYVYKIFDNNGNKVYENTSGKLETDQSKIPLIGENYTVVYRTNIKNTSGEVINNITLKEKPDDGTQIAPGTKYYDPATGTVITGTDSSADSAHVRINVYDNNNVYKGTFTTAHIDWWNGGVSIRTANYEKRNIAYELWYSEGVDNNGFSLGIDETKIFEFSLVTTNSNFKKVTNTISNENDTVKSETLYGKKTINDINKSVALTSKANVSINQSFVDTLDVLASKFDDNYLVYKVTFNTKGWINDEIEIKDTLNNNFSYVTEGVDGYDGLPILKMTNELDQWNTATLVKDDGSDNNAEDTVDKYSVTTNGNTMTIKIKPSKYRKDYHQSNFTVYYLVKSNGNITVDTLSAKNTASITYNNNTISDTATVNVIKEKAYPGLTKKYKGAYGSSTTTMDGVNPKLSEHANENSRLVWTFKAFNDTATNANAISDYTISDVLPVGYEYDNLYSESTDGETKYYPSFTVVKSTGSKTYSAYDGTYIEPTHSTTVIDGETRNVISWHFTDEEFKLEPGEYIEFLISCKLPGTTAKSSVAVNDTYLIINGEYETDSNDDVTTFEGKKALHAQDYVIVGSANVTTASKEVELYEEQQDGYQKASSAETDNNKIEAKVGEDIKYTLNIKNDSPSYVKKLVIIDRLPYVGDKYLSTETTTGRESAFSLKFKEIAEIKIVNENNQTIKTVGNDEYQIDFSDYKGVISSDRSDWNKGSSEITTWHSTYNSNSDVNMRIAFNEDIQLDTDQTIKIVFKATLPTGNWIEASGEGKIAWNNFAYNRTTVNKITGEVGDTLVAESAKVGIWVEKQETQITVNKVWDDNSNFHGIRPSSIKVQLMKRTAGSSDAYVAYGNPIELSGNGDTWGTVVSGLPKYENGNLLEYTFVEVDENGNNEGNINNYVTSDSVESTDSNGYKVVTITNKERTGKIELTKTVKHRENDVSSTTNEKFYFVIKDTTTNKYVLHDSNNKVSSYVFINSLSTYNDLASVLWSINPSENNKLEIDNLILGRTYQVIETNADGIEITNSNSKYLVAYNPSINNVIDENTTYKFEVINKLKLINVTVTKVWDDESNKHNIRPTEITLQLYANGKPVDGKTITISANNALNGDLSKWVYTFTDLRKTDDEGNEIIYTVAEVDNLEANYTVTVGDTTNDGSTISQTITNKENVGQITVTKRVMNYGADITSSANGTYYFVIKQGNDGYVSSDGSVKAYKDSTCIYSIQTGSYDQATYSKTISNLTYGKTYTIIEVDKAGNEIDTSKVNYQITYENENILIDKDNVSGNATIINTLNTTEKKVYKIWEDSSNKHNVRPSSVTLQLYADGVAYGDPVTLTADNIDTDSNKWSYVFTNLKKYKDDGVTEIVYTVKEINLDSHYTKEEKDLTVTNTEITGNVTITKQVFNNDSDITATTDRTFYFIVEQFTNSVSDGYVTSSGELTNDKAKAIFSIKTGANGDANFSKTISGLAVEKSYKVIEVNADGNEATKQNSDYIVEYDNNQTMTLKTLETSASTTVKNRLDTIDVITNKVWNDNDGANGFRPDSILVQLYADNVAVGEKVKLPDESGNWTHTWTGLTKYKENGTDLVTYTVKEFDKDGNESIKNYIQMPVSTETTNDSVTITLTNKEVLGGLTISKYVLNSQGNAITNVPDAFKGPYYVTVVRKDNGNYIDADGKESKAVKVIQLNAGESVTITNIPLTTYKITETDVTGKPKADDNQFTSRFEIIYNNNTQEVTINDSSEAVSVIIYNKIIEKTKLDVTKIWNDSNNLHGLRPEKIIIKLYKISPNGEKIDTNITKEITAPDDNKSANTWTASFENLDKYDENGNEIKYTADEIVVPTNYTKDTKLNSDVIGTTNDSVTITNTEELRSLTVTKKYLNNLGTDITGTAEVTFHFIVEQLNNGTSEGYVNEQGGISSNKTVFNLTIGPNVNNNFSKVINGLTKNRSYKVIETDENGNEITTDNSNFEVSYINQTNTISDSDVNTTITNKLKSRSLRITKKWIDDESHNLRGDIKVTLKADNEVYNTYTLRKENNWTTTIAGLPEYRDNGIDKIIYTVEEDTSTIKNYEQGTIEEVRDNEFVITNTEVTGSINIIKKLLNTEGKVIDDVSDKLSDQIYYVIVKRNSNGHYLDADGKEHYTPMIIPVKANEQKVLSDVALDEYTVTEVNIDGESVEDGFTITDKDGNVINLTVSYNSKTVELTKEIKDGTVIVRNKISDITEVPIKKVWNDKDMNIEHRPISIDVVLYANSAPAKDLNGNEMRATLTEANKVDDYNWTYTFKNLPKYDAKGNKIIYTISEENLRYGEDADETGFYNPTVDQGKLTITNTPVKNNEKVGLTITKEWVGNQYESSHRPKYITFIIIRTDTKEEVRRVNITAEMNWTYTCDDLLKYNDALYEINYEVYEVIPNNDDFKFYDVSGATLLNGETVKKASETSKNNFRITNTFNVPDDKVSIEVQKIWTNIMDNYEDTIPNQIVIEVVGNVDSKEVYRNKFTIDKETHQNSAGTQWNYIIENLPKYDSETGKEISYEVTEDAIKNFKLIEIKSNYTGDQKYVIFKNEQVTGSFDVTKTVFNVTEDGEEKNISDTIKSRYYFTVTCVEKGITYYVDANGKLNRSKVVLSVATGNGVATEIKNLLLDKTYTVTETNDKGEKLTQENSDYVIVKGDGTVTLTEDKNTDTVELINKLQSKRIIITKKWDDNNNAYEKRPESIKFILYRTVGSTTTSKEIIIDTKNSSVNGNSWKYEIDNLPIMDDTGATISYRIVEDQNGLEWYYLSDEKSNMSKNEDSYEFTNTEVVGNYSLQLSKVDDKGFAVGGIKFEIDGKEEETTKNGKIVIIDRKEIFDDSEEVIKIKEISDTSTITNKKYIKLKEELNLHIKKQRVENECKVTGISLDGNVYNDSVIRSVELENGATTTVTAKVIDNNIKIEIVNVEQTPDLSLKKFITKVNDTEITSQTPRFTNKADGTYTYNRSDEVLDVEDNDLITYTIRVYNEGNIYQYAELIEDIIPQGLEFVEDNEINIANGWVKTEDNTVRTALLSKANGEENILSPFIPTNMDSPDYKDLQIVLKVVEPENSDRIVTNRAQIMNQVNKDGEKVDDIDSTPGKWIEGEDDQDWRSVKVKYFDLSLSKYITKVVVIKDGQETVKETGNTAENNNKNVTKVDLKRSEIESSVIKVEYGITIKNEGEIAGTAKKIIDYLPSGFKFEKNDNVNWYEQDGNVVTDELENVMIEPGQTATVKLVLTWNNSATNIGTETNTAEILEDYNESDTPDIDSTPGNKDPNEDDIDNAQIMITVKTGGITYGIQIANCILAIFAVVILGVEKIRVDRKRRA